jgi:branched-chain amino acid aminotransferase
MSTNTFDDRDGLIWYDGRMVPWREANVHVLTHGLHYASSIFEGERVYDGEIFKLTEHSQRLAHSAEVMGFEIPYSVAQIDQACRDTVSAMRINDGYVRPVAWRGSEMMGVSAQANKVHLAIAAWPWPAYFSPEARLQGIRMQMARYRRPSPETAPTDSTGANIFLAYEGVLHTPIPDCFLDGITRRTAIDLARARGVEIVERHVMPDELAGADEIFLTGTAVEITPVSAIDDMTFQVGPITRTLMDDYENLVRRRAAA